MSLVELILLAAALGIDCLVVSFSQGLVFTKNRRKNSFLLALTMGLFQGGMPLLGYLCASVISKYVETFADWIVFGIFSGLGFKFIYEAFHKEEEAKICCIGLRCLISMGIATSIDALGAGVSLHFTCTNIILSVCLIGIVSSVMSLFGFWCGNCLKRILPEYLEIFGGLILITLAVKALL